MKSKKKVKMARENKDTLYLYSKEQRQNDHSLLSETMHARKQQNNF